MKKLKAIFLIRIFALVITFNLVLAVTPKQISAQHNEINFQVFYNNLSPYGQWIDDSNYGYLWIPTAGPDFTPYLTNGYWMFTDYGWMWVSDYDWGWAAFHYGRWDYNGFYGWFWVPDNEWGPSWVTWRRADGYYGWAPMRPGVTINITFGKHNDVPNDRWIFVRDRDIDRHDIGYNYINRDNNYTIINNSTIINRTYYDDKRRITYVAGPDREDVQKITGRTIKPVTVYEKDKPGQNFSNNQLHIYRPQVEKDNKGYKPVPTQLTNIKDVKQISERDAGKRPKNNQILTNKTEMEKRSDVNSDTRIDSKNSEYQPREMDIQKIDKKIDRPVQMQKIKTPKNINSTVRMPAAQTPNPPKKNNDDQTSKQKQNDDKKENKKP